MNKKNSKRLSCNKKNQSQKKAVLAENKAWFRKNHQSDEIVLHKKKKERKRKTRTQNKKIQFQK